MLPLFKIDSLLLEKIMSGSWGPVINDHDWQLSNNYQKIMIDSKFGELLWKLVIVSWGTTYSPHEQSHLFLSFLSCRI